MSGSTDSVIVLLNTKCGGRKSKDLLTQICELIHPSRIVELGQEDTIQKYESYCLVNNISRILEAYYLFL